MLQLRGIDQLGGWYFSDVRIIHCYRKPRSTPSSWAYFSHNIEEYSAVAGTKGGGKGAKRGPMNPLD